MCCMNSVLIALLEIRGGGLPPSLLTTTMVVLGTVPGRVVKLRQLYSLWSHGSYCPALAESDSEGLRVTSRFA